MVEGIEERKNVENEEVVGSLWCGGQTIEIKKLGDTFVNSESEIEDWVHYLNHPWSDTSMGYEVDPNGNGDGWTAEKTVVVYDTVDVKISAIGSTPQEAVETCEEEIRKLSEKYCKN